MDTANTERKDKRRILEAKRERVLHLCSKEINSLRPGHDIYLSAVYSILSE